MLVTAGNIDDIDDALVPFVTGASLEKLPAHHVDQQQQPDTSRRSLTPDLKLQITRKDSHAISGTISFLVYSSTSNAQASDIVNKIADAIKQRTKGSPNDPHWRFRSTTFRLSDLSDSDVRWTFRAYHAQLINRLLWKQENESDAIKNIFDFQAQNLKSLERGYLTYEEATIIKNQLLPRNSSDLVSPHIFKLLLEVLRKSRIIERQMEDNLEFLQITEEYFSAPQPRGRDPRPHKQIFDGLPDVDPNHPLGSIAAREQDLLRLVQAACYGLDDWEQIIYPDAVTSLRNYCQAFYRHRSLYSDQEPSVPILPFERNWTLQETAMLERGHLVCNLREQVEKGKLNFNIFKLIRGSLVPMELQPYYSANRLAELLQMKGQDSSSGVGHELAGHVLALHSDNFGANEERSDYEKFITEAQQDMLSTQQTQQQGRLQALIGHGGDLKSQLQRVEIALLTNPDQVLKAARANEDAEDRAYVDRLVAEDVAREKAKVGKNPFRWVQTKFKKVFRRWN
ncbi:hypothetical protein BDV96DRAFT_561970 [Lophiotrema nucula]|uniref:Uncharacterized protein n=1 Tax=Lophiotrema nucula TaxID=690887 RepID=A0A6A5ZW34_9PLEO|nr:hypothetical protein BDV96DRAFT_561970 [Lophiotrema nucula]